MKHYWKLDKDEDIGGVLYFDLFADTGTVYLQLSQTYDSYVF